MSTHDPGKVKVFDEDELKDGLENLIAQLGTEQDKRSHTTFVNKKRLSIQGNQQELNALYRTDWLAGKVVDIIPDDMTREWRSFNGDIDSDTIDILVDEEERLQLPQGFNEAHKWARLYGTAFLVMSIDDGQPPDKPLLIEKIKEGGLRHIKAIDRHRLQLSDTVNNDPMSKNYGMPEFYRFADSSIRIHYSRVLRFDGVKLPFDEFRQNNYYSDSVLDRLYESLINFNVAAAGASSMIYETNVDIMKVKGLMNYLQTAEGEKLIRKRFALAGVLKSFNNMMLLDTEEEFQNKTNTFSGLPDLIDRFSQILSAATDIPATRLLGSSASGMNATGEGDLKNYYDMIRSKQNFTYKPQLDYFDQIMIMSLRLKPEDDYKYKFNSLFQLSDKEQADLDYTKSQRDQIYLDRDVVSPSIVAKDLQQADTYTNLDDDYIKELEDAEDEEELIDPLVSALEEEEAEEGGASQSSEESGSEISEAT